MTIAVKHRVLLTLFMLLLLAAFGLPFLSYAPIACCRAKPLLVLPAARPGAVAAVAAGGIGDPQPVAADAGRALLAALAACGC